MILESISHTDISLKDSLDKVPLANKPRIKLFAECIDRHRKLSLEQKRQWLTFVTTYEYKPRGSVTKPKGAREVSDILGIMKEEVERHMETLGDFPNFDILWEKLQKEINEEKKKDPNIFKNSHIKQDPISQKESDKIKELRKAGRLNAVIAQMTGLPENRVNHHVRKLVAKREIPSRGHTKSSPTAQP